MLGGGGCVVVCEVGIGVGWVRMRLVGDQGWVSGMRDEVCRLRVRMGILVG